jgi:hypothetical protein
VLPIIFISLKTLVGGENINIQNSSVALFSIFQQCGVIIFINALLWQTQKGSCARMLVLSVSLNIRRAPFMCAKTAYAAAASLSSQFSHKARAAPDVYCVSVCAPHNFLQPFCRLFALCFES